MRERSGAFTLRVRHLFFDRKIQWNIIWNVQNCCVSATECFVSSMYFHKIQNPRNHFTSHSAFVSLWIRLFIACNAKIETEETEKSMLPAFSSCIEKHREHSLTRSLTYAHAHSRTHSLSKYIIWLIIMHALRLIIIRFSGFFGCLFVRCSSRIVCNDCVCDCMQCVRS